MKVSKRTVNRFRTLNVSSRTHGEIVSNACKWFEVGTPHDALGSLFSAAVLVVLPASDTQRYCR
jgi:hypothetical protein